MAGAPVLCPTTAELGFPPLQGCTYPPLWKNQVFFQSLSARAAVNRGAGKKPGSNVLSSYNVSRRLNGLFIAALRENKTQSADVSV